MPIGGKGGPKEPIKPKVPEAYPTQHDPLTRETPLPVRERFQQFVVNSTQTAIQVHARGLQGEQWRSIRVSNLSAQWLYIAQAKDFVPPYTWNAILPLTGANVVECAFIAPLGITQPAQSGANPDAALCWVSENEWQPQPGTPITTSSAGLSTQVQGIFADEATGTPNPVVIGGQNGTTVESLQVDSNDALLVNNSTTEPWDDGPAVHLAAAYPGSVSATPSGTSTTINLLPANVNGNTFVSPNAPVSGLTMQGFPSMLDVRHIRLYIDNHGTSASITAVQISSAQTTGSTTETLTYSPTVFANIANNTGTAIDIPIPKGLYPSVNVILTITAAAGTITVQPIFYTQPQTAGTVVDRSGTLSSGGSQQQLMAANSARRYLFIQNTGTSTLWLNFTTNAVQSQPSIQLLPGAAYEMVAPGFVSTELVSIIGPTTSQAFTAKEA